MEVAVDTRLFQDLAFAIFQFLQREDRQPIADSYICIQH